MTTEARRLPELFQEILLNFLPEFLLLVAPRQAPRLKLEHGEFVQPAESLEGDMIFRTETLDGQPVIVLIHVAPEGLAADLDHRMARAGLSFVAQPDVSVLPIAVLLEGGGEEGQREIYPREVRLDAAGFWSVRFRYLVVAMSRGKAEAYLARKDPLASALASLMPYGGGGRVEHKLRCLQKIASARELNPHRRNQLCSFVHEALPLDSEEEKTLEARIPEELRDFLRSTG